MVFSLKKTKYMDSKHLKINYKHFFEENVNLLCIASLEGYFVKVNNAFENLLGYTEKELLTYSFLDFIHINDIDKTVAELANLAAGKTIFAFQNRYRTKSGNYVSLLWNAKVDKSSGFIYASATDVSASQLVRTVLHDTQRLAKVGGWEVDFKANKIYWSEGIYLIHELPLSYEVTLEKAINSQPIFKKMIQDR